MSAFLQQAEQILETARHGGTEECRLAILVGWDGGIRMISETDWELEPLRLHHGARAAYRVTRSAGRVELEGRSVEGSCLLHSGSVWDGSADRIGHDFPRYQIA